MAKEPENPFFPSSTPAADLDLVSLDAYEDEVAWLNDVLTGSSYEEAADLPDSLLSLAELDTKLSRLLAQLDSACAETSSQVDRAIDDISRSVPRLSFDLQLMREHALLLRFTLDGIRKRSSALPNDASQPASNGVLGPMDPNTYQVMERLRVLDMVKGRMEASRDVLREAESWSTLDSEVTALITEQAYGKAADRLAEAAKSMVVFQNTPEYEARRALMISLQNSLEASLSTSLVSAISSRDVKACKSYFSLFGQIQREAEFRNYYYGSRRAPLVNSWSSANLSDCIPTSSPSVAHTSLPAQPFSAFLPGFYDDLRLVLEEERSYVSSIFPNPLPTLSSFLSSTLDALTPSLSQRLTECADVHGPSTLNELITLYHATEDFALRVESIMARLIDPSASVSPAQSPSVNTPTSAREKRMSKRMSRRLSAHSPSLSGIGTLGDISESDTGEAMEMAKSWEVALFEPFLDWQVEYLALEARFLSASMHGEGVLPGLLESGASGQQMRVFWDEIQHVFAACEEAMVRNAAFTHGYGWVQCVQAVDECLSAHLKQQIGHLDRLSRKQRDLAGDGRGKSAKEVDLDGLDYSTEDWNLFQLGLKLLSICRQFATRLAAFEEKLQARMAIHSQAIKAARPVVPGTTNGAISLLRQSTLFSTELSALLDQASDASQRQPLCHVTFGASNDLAKSCQNLVHQTILRPLIASLSSYASLSAWSATTDSRPEAKSAFDLNMPTFSLSPTEVISRLGEGLFNLPSLFEVYADDDALSVSLETLPFVDPAYYQAMQAASTPSVHVRRQSSYGSTPDSESLSASTASKVSKPEPLSAEAVISAWLSSLTLTVLAHLTGTALPAIRSLTSHGSAQLASDLAHISNVAKALDVESEDLERWKEVSEMSDAEGRRCIQDASGEGDRILLQMGKMRRWG